MNSLLAILGDILLLVGAIFLFLGALGIFRFPDVYNRLQAGTKATTLGSIGMVIGIGLMEPSWFPKMFVIAMFILVGNPLSSHALARASYKAGVPLWDRTTVNACEDLKEETEATDVDAKEEVQ